MTNKKRANKIAKITVASAIALSALAQPLGNVITVKAAETPATTKAESKLLQATGLQASFPVTLKNAQFTSTNTSIPNWDILATTSFSLYSLGSKNSDGYFSLGSSGINPNGEGGYLMRMPTPIGDKPAYAVRQIVDTIPGMTYTYTYDATGVSSVGDLLQVSTVYKQGINSSGTAIEVPKPLGANYPVYRGSTRHLGVSFVANSEKTSVAVLATTANGDGGPAATVLYNNFKLEASSTGSIATPTINTVTDNDTVVTGTGTAGKTVRIELPDGTFRTGTVGNDGKYSIEIPKQAKDKVIKVMLYDNQGNASPEASTTVIASTVAAPTINPVTTDDTVVKGTGIPGQRVYYKVGNANWYEYNYATVETDGTYMFYISQQQVGTPISVKHTVGGVDSAVTTTTVTQGTVAAPTINGVKSDDTTVKGTGIAGATVTVTIGGQDYTATVGQDGNYSVTIPAQAVGTVITAKQTLNGKTSSSVNTTVTQGTVAAPTINTVTTDDTIVKGTGINGATVTVTVGGQDYTATVSGGEYSVTISKQPYGTQITAKQTLNNQTSSSVNTTVTQGTVAAPTINGVKSDDTTVKGTGIAGATVTITIGGQDRTATVGQDGNYSVTIPAQAVGTVITAKQTLNGKTSSSVNTTVTQGTVAAPTINGVTTDDTTVKGTGIAGATVTVTIGGQDKTATVDQDGNYSVTISKQAAGTVITAKQSLNGQTSGSVNTTVTQGTVAAPTINGVTTDDTTVKGTGIPGATVTVTVGGQDKTATVGQDGNYSVTISKQAVGTVITAKQTLNGQTSGSVNTTVTQGALEAPVINPVTSDDIKVTGTGIKGAVVTLSIAGHDYTGLVEDNGTYSITIVKQPAGTEILAKQELNGKYSVYSGATVTQGAVTPPTVNPVTTDDTVVTGTGMKGATVKVTLGGIDYTGTVDNNGNYSIPILKQPFGTVITATETLNGKTSAATIATVTQGTVAAPTINSLTTEDTIVRGTGITGAVVTITIGSSTYTGTVTNGEYAITIPKQAAGTVVNAKQTLNDKASSSVSTTVTQGAIAAPTVSAVTTDDTTVKGTGLAGATVTVTIGSSDYTGTVATNGTYSITIPKQAFGTAITVKQALNGKTSANASTTVTQGAVAAPTVSAVTTDDTLVKGTGIAGATVTVTIGSTPYTGTVAANGTYSITIPKQAFGTAITVKQALNGKTSANASTTVTQGTVAAPTVSAVTTDDTTVKGTGIAGATVTVTIGSTPYTGTVAANGTYSITIPKQAFGTAITVKQALNGKTSANASTTVTQGAVAAPTIGAVTTDDTTVKGTGIAGATVTVTIGSTPYTGTVAANGTYSITIPKQAAGTVISAKQTLNSKTSSSVNTTVTSTQTTLTADSFTVGVDSYIKGTYTGSVAKIAIEVNGTLQQKITVASSPYQYYAKGKVTAATDQVYVISYNANGDQLKRVKVDVKRPTAGTLTPDTYYLGSDNYVTGTLTGDITKFSLTVNGTEYAKINVSTAPTFRYYANNLIRSLTDIVTVNGYDSTGKLLDSKPVTVGQDRGNPGTIATVAPFKLGKDSYVTGTYTGDIAKVELQVNDVTLQRISVPADGTIKYYAKGKINNTTDVVKLVGYNTAGVAVSTKLVTISNSDGSITANPYVIGTDSYVKGTFTGDVAKISLTVNGDKKTTISVPTPGPNYQYYAKTLITNATDVVVVTAYDATGGILDTKTVAVSKPTVVTTGTVTPSAYKIGTNTYVDGTYTGDVAKVALEINGVLNAPIPATGNTIHYYAGSLIASKTDVVNVIVYDAAGKQLDKKQVTITAPEGTVTPNTLKTTDGYLTGSATGDVAKVTLSVNGVKQASITVVQADGTYRYYVKPLALTPADVVKVIGLDSRGNEITSANVTITN
ncbi:hypothetical protein HB847_12825 [Listeria booriae]|uniref:Gram-positive cocci surface proteins LPxTG domain-containing protein n=1 Tax=Listeria booriae TaxID=1552123 RepID=A0A841Y8I7_9LIST|nr:immunoglobulin-like domain-containing protein [Listeria booriae]MBC1373254.1 hypothetical protein [Listeria booriae]